MRIVLPLVALAALTGLAACQPAAKGDAASEAASEVSGGIHTDITPVAAADVPAEIIAVAQAAVPGMTILEAERKDREGRVYYDVEGTRPDGSEVELDMLQEGSGFRVVEIQRDIKWADAPAVARKVAGDKVVPVRVIESMQADDGAVIYELFAEGKPAKPSLEVRVKDGKAKVLTEEWPH